MDNRADIRDFLVSRRAKLRPEQVGLPVGTRRRVPGLRREEVAVLAGVSPEWYARLEKGHIAGVSDEVLHGVSDALRLDEEERAYLLDLARVARPSHSRTRRQARSALAPAVQWMLDSITLSAAFVCNGRLDVIGSNVLGRALLAPMFASSTTVKGKANFARYHFLDPGSRAFFVDWQVGAVATVALLRAEAGRHPHDRALRELIGELCTISEDYRKHWAMHEVKVQHDGVKRLHHPEVGDIDLTYQSVNLPTGRRAGNDVSFLYTAEPGSINEDKLRLLASWAAPAAETLARALPGKAAGGEASTYERP